MNDVEGQPNQPPIGCGQGMRLKCWMWLWITAKCLLLFQLFTTMRRDQGEVRRRRRAINITMFHVRCGWWSWSFLMFCYCYYITSGTNIELGTWTRVHWNGPPLNSNNQKTMRKLGSYCSLNSDPRPDWIRLYSCPAGSQSPCSYHLRNRLYRSRNTWSGHRFLCGRQK